MNKDNKKLVVESVFIKEALKRKLSLEEFLVLLYFDNSFDAIFDVPAVAKTLKMNENSVLEAFSKLMDKNLIKVDATPNTFGKVIEHINLDNYYEGIVEDTKLAKKEENKNDIFSAFESVFGRTLSQMDYEIIKAWLDKGFTEELILGALQEAAYNGVTSLRYIDKILFEWHKKGFKSMEDVKNHLKNNDSKTNLCETKVLDFDWLDSDE
jgi:DNA replication protein